MCVCTLTERLRHICYLATDSRVFRTGLMVREKRFSARCDNKKPSWEIVLWVAWAQFPPKIRLYHLSPALYIFSSEKIKALSPCSSAQIVRLGTCDVSFSPNTLFFYIKSIFYLLIIL